jgi:hypothetical protein
VCVLGTWCKWGSRREREGAQERGGRVGQGKGVGVCVKIRIRPDDSAIPFVLGAPLDRIIIIIIIIRPEGGAAPFVLGAPRDRINV